MILTKQFTVKWSKANKEYYESQGYKFTKLSDLLNVETEHLTKGSHARIDLQCDYCNIKFSKVYKDFRSQKDKCVLGNDCCGKCQKIKNKEVLQIKYGTDNVMKVQEFKDNLKHSNLQKYGVENYASTQEFKDKIEKNNLQKYGVTSFLVTDEFKQKSKETCLKRYGVEHIFHNEEFLSKRMEQMKDGGMVAVSAPQKFVHSVIGGELNYLVGRSYLDIAFPSESVYLEYDGGGHNLGVKMGKISQEDFDKKEMKRSFFLRDLGWREIRIVTDNDVNILKEELENFFNQSMTKIKEGTAKSIKWYVEEKTIIINNKTEIAINDFLSKK